MKIILPILFIFILSSSALKANDSPDLLTLYKELHAFPELSFKEYRTSKLIADRLEKFGIITERNIGKTGVVGTLMGEKIVLTELIAFGDLSNLIEQNLLSERSSIIASYALCGFANFGSIGIQLGGIGAMAPERRNDLSNLVIKAMIGGALASWLTASIAGILI